MSQGTSGRASTGRAAFALPSPPDDAARDLARDLGVSLTAATVLRHRGYDAADGARAFLDPKLSGLSLPDAMQGRREAIVRLARAVRAKERICIFGDYDADGVTSAAVMTEALELLGGEVVTCLADRFDGGYGVSNEAMARILSHGPTLLVTCDCGTSDHARLALARERGVDVIVIDHHRVPEEPLPVLAFLNPHRPDCAYPYKGLASVGLALTLVAGVRAELGVALDVRRWLDLVALGTIADVAPLDGDNRALVRAGLAALSQGARPGIAALAAVTKTQGSLTGEDVAFRYAPRINAPGRLAKPDLALRLLLAKTAAEAGPIAEQVFTICEQRKTLDRAVLAEALVLLEDPELARLPVIVLGKPGWHAGIVGIVAGRLASRFGKPTIVIGFDGDTGRGSVRGPAGFPLHDALTLAKAALLGFGGHQAAAGVHVELSKLGTLRDLFADACIGLGARSAGSPAAVTADAVLEPGDRPVVVHRDLTRFEPCGQANPAPRIVIEGAKVTQTRAVGNGHLQIELQTASGPLRGFGLDLASTMPRVGATVHVLGKLRPDDYRGAGAVELMVDALMEEGAADAWIAGPPSTARFETLADLASRAPLAR
jgi:single-stranded-DNA-specific exonuclease